MPKPARRAKDYPLTELGRSMDALRQRLGAIDRELSYNALARLLTTRLKRKPPLNGGTLLKWATGRGHPDPWALLELAALASMPVDRFVLGEKGAASRRDRLEKERAERGGLGPMHYGHDPDDGTPTLSSEKGTTRRQG